MAHLLDGIVPEEPEGEDAYGPEGAPGAGGVDRRYGDRQLVRRITPYFRGRGAVVAFVTAAVVVAAVAGSAVPVLLARTVDRAVADGSGGTVTRLVAAILLAGTAAWLFTFLQQRLTGTLVGDVVLKLRQDAFHAATRQDMAFYDTHPTGALVSRVTNDTQSFAALLTMVLSLLGQVLMVVVLMAALFLIHVPLALVTAAVAAVIVAVSLAFRSRARVASLAQQRALAEVGGYVHETLRGIAVARNHRGERAAEEGLREVNGQWFTASVRLNRLFSGVFPLLISLTGLGTVAVVLLGGRFVDSGALSAGEWVLFLEALALFWSPLTSIASFWNQLQQGLAAGERIFSLIDRESAVRQTGQRPVPRLRGELELRGVSFGYHADRPVLQDIDLRIAAGESVALVGHTGAGKSSLVRLLTRAYEFQEGSILADGQDVRTLDLDEYRRCLGVVTQTPFLFSGTVADNIALGRPDADRAAVEAAARAVAGGDWLAQLPQGLDTATDEGGRNLSTGQRQIIALARVFLQDAPVLVLDEATASIDPLTEAQIQEGLDTLAAGRTTVVVAHRLPTVRKADRIVVVDGGRLIEQGDHATLLGRGGAYSRLYERYFRHQRPDLDPADEAPADTVVQGRSPAPEEGAVDVVSG
ncbi:ABC transporter ATP-binding protein [Streptomyces venezuelae]|uniref:ABC transporter ATP-binding protein n=1 Tax=Streptomyces venezuelae TaxID=54571 RepID=A0A5P2CV48_STRVZ|nr:ABC transporter ATP-binding protein [Streptomyces venezuelae]QES46725.1 ABC transporter ATP-binding protein [Streptomyces venezuelae]